MPTPSALLGLPQIAGSDSPDIPRDLNAVISRFEALRNTFATRTVLDVGMPGQIRAGRPLTILDFTGIGLSTPLILANLSTLAGAGSNLGSGGNLVNKGAVPNAPGIMGAAGEAAQFAGATAQALYIPDVGAGDPFRLRTGSWAIWVNTMKRGIRQVALSKAPTSGAAADLFLWLEVTAGNLPQAIYGSGVVPGSSDVADGRWHWLVGTHDGTITRLYVDGALEGRVSNSGILAGVAGPPLNIGGQAADGATAASNPFYGREDEGIVTSDVLSDDQVRYLYCASLLHTLPVLPRDARLLVRRQKRGAPLASTDFPAPPSRMHNFPAGALANEGSDANGAAGTTATLALNAGTGAIVPVAGPDGAKDGAYSFSGAHTGLSATDAGLVAALAARSGSVWFKTTSAGTGDFLAWGTALTGDFRLGITAGALQSASGADAIGGPRMDDGIWHHIAVVEDNAAADGVKRKLYLDGRLIGGSTVLTALTPAGANRFRVGAASDGTRPLPSGQVARPAVFAGALTAEQVRTLFLKGSQALAASPKAAEDHVEAFEATRTLVVFDGLEGSDQVDLMVTA